MVRSIHSNYNPFKSLSIKALKIAVYILNRAPTKSGPKMSFELLKCLKPILHHVYVWECSSEVRIYNPQEEN
jgi:hypothetical protein